MMTFEPGCYFDSHQGHYVVPAIIKLAYANGSMRDPFVEYALSRYDEDHDIEGYPSEALIDESDKAIEYLNTALQAQGVKGFTWRWDEGDFGLYPDEDDE
jgi:hypothetical protein